MSESCLILGLESSCDETAAALVADGHEVLSSVVASQAALHERYGGVVPEVAARAHIENIIPVLREAMAQARVAPDQIDAVAVAQNPGLTPALIVAITMAKTLAWAWQKPLIGINHIHGHLQSALIGREEDLFPAIALIVSGGHTSLYHCRGSLDLDLLGCTLDDAAGEAFDKVAMILKLPYPGGPSIEKLARDGDARAIDFPRTYLSRDSLDFSFSGLKTAVLYHCRGQDMQGQDRVDQMSHQEKADVAASFQAAVVDVLVKKALRAVHQKKVRTVLVGGGVAANGPFRERLQQQCERERVKLVFAEKKYCTDNAAMVAALAYYKLRAGELADLAIEPHAADRPSQKRLNEQRKFNQRSL